MAPDNIELLRFCLIGSGAVRCNLHRGGPCQVVSFPNGEHLLVDVGRNAVHNLTRFGYCVEDINYVFITHLGFEKQRPFIRMARGNNPFPGSPQKQFASAGPELG